MKTIQECLIKQPVGIESLKRAFMDACHDKAFLEYVESLPFREEELIQYTSTLQDACTEQQHCASCKGIFDCKNAVRGYCLTPQKPDQSIIFSYVACPYQSKLQQEQVYLKMVSYYEIPKEIQRASFQSLYKDDKKRIPIMQYFKEVLLHCKEEEKPKGMYLHGSFGSGKTYMISALFHELARRNIKSSIVYVPELLSRLKASFSSHYQEVFDAIKKAPFLLLDDIGAENMTVWARDEVIGPILQYRMESHLPTFFTSNLTLEQLESHFAITSNGVDQIKARRLIERIRQLTIDSELVSQNRRH